MKPGTAPVWQREFSRGKAIPGKELSPHPSGAGCGTGFMSSTNAHRSELGEFLKARRAELSPREMGLPDSGVLRRIPGLRREEVAQLASMSTDYYTRDPSVGARPGHPGPCAAPG